MNKPRVVFWLGTYSVQRESPSGIGQRLIQIVKGMQSTCEALVICTSMEAEPDPAIADILTTNTSQALSWGDVLYGFDNVPAEILKNFKREGKVIVAENHTPVEHLYYQREPRASVAAHRAALATYRTQLAVADKFIVRSQPERIAVLDGLCLAGRIDYATVMQDESLSRLVEIVPIGVLSEEISEQAPSYGHDLKVVPIVWNGGLWDFHDPGFLIDAAASLALQGKVSFFFPFPATTGTHAMRLLASAVERNSLGNAVSIGHPKEAFQALNSGGAFLSCVGRHSVENELCLRLRTWQIFRFRSPMIVDGFGATGNWIRTTGMGIALDSNLERAGSQIATAIEQGSRRQLVEAIDHRRPSVLLDQLLVQLGIELQRLVANLGPGT